MANIQREDKKKEGRELENRQNKVEKEAQKKITDNLIKERSLN